MSSYSKSDSIRERIDVFNALAALHMAVAKLTDIENQRGTDIEPVVTQLKLVTAALQKMVTRMEEDAEDLTGKKNG